MLRLYVRQLPPGSENLHKELKTILSGIKIKIADTENDGIHTTIYAGYNPLRPKHAETYILQTYPDGTTLFYLITVN